MLYEQNDVAKVLLNHKANPNVREPEKGATPLASAISNSSLNLVRALVAAGADKTAPIMTGQKALPKDLAGQIAKANGSNADAQQIAAMLQ